MSAEGVEPVGGGGGHGALWRASLAPALLGGGLAALLAALAGLLLARRRRATCLRRDCSLQQACRPHPQLYTTEPSKRNGKSLTPPDGGIRLLKRFQIKCYGMLSSLLVRYQYRYLFF